MADNDNLTPDEQLEQLVGVTATSLIAALKTTGFVATDLAPELEARLEYTLKAFGFMCIGAADVVEGR